MYKSLCAGVLTCLIVFFSCKGAKHTSITQVKKQEKPITYLYTYHDDDGNPLDSLKVYNDDAPFEQSLELYADADTLNKTVSMMVYMGIFKVEGQKFAVITDTTGTAFFRFEKGRYHKIFSDTPSIAFMIAPVQYKDFNGDGYTDVLYHVSSGGSYGDDDFLMFYDPKAKTLIHNPEPALRNVEISGQKVVSGDKFWWDTYIITGTKLVLSEKLEYLQGDYSDKKVIWKYNDMGAVIRIDTLAVEPE